MPLKDTAFTALGLLSVALPSLAAASYLHDMSARRRELRAGARVAHVNGAAVEYALRGRGSPALVIHGAGGGHDQGVLLSEALPPGFMIVAPSRFGYLASATPRDASAR